VNARGKRQTETWAMMKEPGLDDLEYFQLTQIAKSAKIRRVTIRTACPGKKNQGCCWTTFC
jgi:hypothetical protein